MVTIKDISKELGIAVSTVSKGLNNASDISDETRQLVLDTAVKMGYTPTRKKSNGSILNSSPQPERRVCILIENMDYENRDEFGYELILGFRQAASMRNWSVDIIPFNLNAQSSNQFDKLMITNRYSGAFILGFSMHEDYSIELAKTRIPTVLFENYITGNPKIGYVGTDCYESLKLAVSHLKHLGHKRIAFLNGAGNSMVSQERINAFVAVMNELDLHVSHHLTESGYYVPDCAKYHVPKFLDYGATAIICASDLIASGAISEVTKRGLSVPTDISIIGFDDLPFCANLTPPLTAIRQDRLNLGRSAMTMLDNLINNIPVSKTILHSQLIVRESTTFAPI